MNDADCVEFLQWALPRLRLRWPGFRKVRRQVCKRLDHRLKELGLSEVSEYPAYLDSHPDEWPALDTLCRISISRFYRDRGVFEYLERKVLPQVAQAMIANGEAELRCWSIGCASGEEPYTLAILWKLRLTPRFPSLKVRILATDADLQGIARAERGCYPASSLKDLPEAWRATAFLPTADGYCVAAEYRESVTFLLQDIRTAAPGGVFHLIFCRNVAFTYFEEALQRETLDTIVARLAPGGALVIGSLESLPAGAAGLEGWSTKLGVYRKPGSAE